MSIHNFIPQIWSKQLLIDLRKNLVIAGLANQDYTGEIADAGDTVKIQTPGAVTINPYTPRTTDINYQVPTSTTQSLVIDQDNYFAFSVDDLEEVQANVDLMSTFSAEASYAMADKIDNDIASLYTAAGSTLTLDITTNVDEVRKTLIAAGVKLDEANVPTEGRFLVLSPTVMGAVRDKYGERMTDLGDEIVQKKGYVGSLEGFNLYMSNNVAKVTVQHKCLFGTSAAITVAYQLVKIEALRLEKRFEDALRGRSVWGRKVVRPAALGVIDVKTG